jgi:hypothetical protein
VTMTETVEEAKAVFDKLPDGSPQD